ncbi:MAG TPA: hypothetical protein VNO30_49655 [Kofleriaceae bacterium]|nr:hypothetical protein [Kofleriaceae bacterium]
MSKRIVVAAFLCAGLIAACGGSDGSGVERSKSLVSLNDDEITDLCEYFADVTEKRVVDCGGGLTVTFQAKPVAECVADHQQIPASCSATVGDAEDCNTDFADLTDEQLCSDGALPASCQVLFACGAL